MVDATLKVFVRINANIKMLIVFSFIFLLSPFSSVLKGKDQSNFEGALNVILDLLETVYLRRDYWACTVFNAYGMFFYYYQKRSQYGAYIKNEGRSLLVKRGF